VRSVTAGEVERGAGSSDHRALPGRFRVLFGANVVSNVGDGLAITAFPLLAATLTRDPLSIALVLAAGDLPFALFALFGGVLVDRLDRRRVMVTVNGLLAVAVAALVACTANHVIGVAGVAAFAAAIGVGGCIFAVASQAALPQLVGSVDRHRMSQANGRLFGSQVLGMQLVGPAVGGAVFAAGHQLPFALDAATFAAAAMLIAAIPGRYRPPAAGPPEPFRAAVAAGVCHVVRSRLLLTITFTFAGANLVVAAEEAVLVVLAERRLGLGSLGYGLLFASLAVGGLAATGAAGHLARRLQEATVFRLGVALLPIGALVTGLAPDAVTCGVGLAATSFGVMTLNVAGGALRQAILPPRLLGRAYAVMTALGKATLPVGAVLGGLLARIDPRVPFLAGAAVALVLVAASLPGLSRRALEAARAAAATEAADAAEGARSAHPA
jgi:MFS family permease